MDLLNRAIGLAYHELKGEANDINTEMEKYHSVGASDVQKIATESLIKSNSSTLVYNRKK
jgi:zinc protease